MVKVTVKNGSVTEDIELDGETTSEDILKKMGLYLDAHLVLKGTTPLPIDEILKDGDTIRIIKVASGG